MFKSNKIYLAVTAALVMSSGVASADVEVSGYIKNETAFYTDGGQLVGEEESQYDEDGHHGDTLKFENSARIFINGDIGEESTYHVDLNLIMDGKGVENEYQYHEMYTQYDWLREAYIDTKWGNADIRIGKQQVVWGTADGIKLLDIINPTDYRELNQNTPDDARIPIWMVNADIPVGETGSFQVILAQAEENKIPGLDKDGDDGHPFTFKGVDTITGEVNGFLNIAPALAKVATTFTQASMGGAFDANSDGAGDFLAGGLVGFSGLSVSFFADSTLQFNADQSIRANFSPGVAAAPGDVILDTLADTPTAINPGLDPRNGNNDVTNLVNPTYIAADPDSAFEYMSLATFETFNTFAGFTGAPGAQTSVATTYVRDYPDDEDGNFGFRYKNATEGGINWSANYFYHYDSNPSVGLSWHDAVTGTELETVLVDSINGVVTRDQVDGTLAGVGGGNTTTVYLRDPATNIYYGAANPGFGFNAGALASAGVSANGTELRFTESINRIHSLGGSMDMALDSFAIPTVLRLEALYNKDELHPVIDKRLLAIGDLEGALQAEEHDVFKYVVGLDLTVLTNMLVSTQFIQFRNLDFQDDDRTCSTQTNTFGTSEEFDCSRYTGDAPTLHLSNGLQQAEENKEFISIFLSKPFGSDQQGRWNNILILEDTGGRWNRFDVEYGFSDELIGSVELNTYWGDDDSWFGQLENTSSIQVGMKYIFD